MYANHFLWRREKGGEMYGLGAFSQNDNFICVLSSSLNNEGFNLKENVSLLG